MPQSETPLHPTRSLTCKSKSTSSKSKTTMTKKILCPVCGSRASTYVKLEKHVGRVHPGVVCPPRAARRAVQLSEEETRARWRRYAAKRKENGQKAIYDKYNRRLLRLGPRPELLGREPPADLLPEEPVASQWALLKDLSLEELEKMTPKHFETIKRRELLACAPDCRPRISRLRFSQVALQQAIRYRVTRAAVDTAYKEVLRRVQDIWDTERARIEDQKTDSLARLSEQRRSPEL